MGVSVTLDRLAALMAGAIAPEHGMVRIDDLAYDSRAVNPGTAFFCVPGAHADGHDHAGAARAAGAAALIVSRDVAVDLPQVRVASVRRAMADSAAAFFNEPSRALRLVGVTGTNGKTTTTYLLESVFKAAGMTAGLIGNIERHVGDAVLPASRNTPEAIDLQRLLASMRDAGVAAAAMEVSSEGLLFDRVEGTWFACAIFTNLAQDHLNTHGTMEAYFQAKALLFRPSMCERAVINIDDAYGRRLVADVSQPVVTFSLDPSDDGVDVVPVSMTMDRTGTDVVARALGKTVAFRVPMPARHNVANALGAVAAAVSLEIGLDAVAAGISALPGVPGRLESIDAGQDFTVLVDYAHTPDSLENILGAARELVGSGARLIAVFGCGGDRDRTKRALMGKAVVSLADRAIITSDNPRSEDPLAIIAMVQDGARETGRPFESIPDRRAAIEAAIDDARAGDVIVIAGKGHETGQEFADHTIPFDDRVVARAVLAKR